MVVLHNEFGNTATIETIMLYPYKGAPRRQKSFVLSLTSDYDNNFMYHRSVYETAEDAVNELLQLGGGNWHLEKNNKERA